MRNHFKATWLLKTVPFFASAVIYLVGLVLSSIVIRGVQPNGLAEVQAPYSLYGFILEFLAIGLFMSGVCFNLAF